MSAHTDQTLSEQFAAALCTASYDTLPAATREMALKECIDTFGLMIAARRSVYTRQLMNAWDAEGDCTVLGHTRALDAAGAALVNGAAIHGEDFDDTLEGAPIRVAAMVLPGVLAACERYGASGKEFLLGLVVGLEAVCRLNRVAAGKIHSQCFHPVGVIGPFGSAAGVAAALGLGPEVMARAFGIAGSLSSGIIEYLSEGAWTKRMHPGWAAQSGYRAVRIAQQGLPAPRKVFEGPHGFFKAFSPKAEPQFQNITEGVGEVWQADHITFKPYACGTMIHPYIDCMRRLAAQGVDPEKITDIECKTGEGFVNRLWEPLANKHRPPSGYAAKFSVPWCMAIGFFEDDAGLSQFDEEKVHDPKVLRLSEKIRYVIDPENEYPDNYSGHVKATFADGSVIELNQPHMRGGMREPLTMDELVRKFHNNVAYGGWSSAQGDKLLDFIMELEKLDSLSRLRSFRW